VACLLKRDRRDAQMRQAPLAAGSTHSIFVDKEGRLLTCGIEFVGNRIMGHALEDLDVGPFARARRVISLPTPVPSMQDRRIVSVATSALHCLALGAEGEVYSWGRGDFGSLVPSRIESLSRVECIAAGSNWKSSAVDEDGRLFT